MIRRCSICGSRGVVKIGYHEPPSEGYRDYGICSCAYGRKYRTPNGRACLVAALHVSPELVNLIEDLLDPEDLTGYQPQIAEPLIDVADAGRRQKRVRL